MYACVCVSAKKIEEQEYFFLPFFHTRPDCSSMHSNQTNLYAWWWPHLLRNALGTRKAPPYCAKANNQAINLHFCRTCHNCLKSSQFHCIHSSPLQPVVIGFRCSGRKFTISSLAKAKLHTQETQPENKKIKKKTVWEHEFILIMCGKWELLLEEAAFACKTHLRPLQNPIIQFRY